MRRCLRSCATPLLALLTLSWLGCSGGGGEAPAAPADDATLASLAVSAGSLSPAFASATQSYALVVPNGTAAVRVVPAAHDAKAQALAVRQDSGALYAVSSGSPSFALAVPAVGVASTLTVRVIAADGKSHEDYSIALTQAARVSSDASLSALAVSAGSLSPAFASTTLSYGLAVPNGAASLTVTATAHDAKARSIAVRQDAGAWVAVASGAASAALTVPAVGASSTVTVQVTAEDGTTANYALAVTQAAPVAASAFTIYSIGDSTMADYDPAVYPDQRGWCQIFPQFLTGSDVAFVNAAKNGRSSKSYYVEGSWAAVQAKLKAGDYVFIQFAHNDEKDNGLEGTGGIGTEPFGAFQVYLGKYVDETRAAGATPILVGPVVRRYFSGSTLTPAAAHDLTGTGDPSIPVAQDLNYVEAMKQVGTAKSCPVIDLTASTKQLVEQFGPTDAKSILYISADDTHLQPLGATLFAQLAVQELISRGILASHLNPAADLIVSPAALDFGSIYLGNTVDKTVSATGLSLSPATGNVTIAAPPGFLVGATAGGSFGPSLQLAYSGGRLAPTDFQVRFAPAAAQAYAGTVTVTPDTGTVRSVAVSGTALTVSTGGTESAAVYSLTVDQTCTATGLATCAAEVFSNLALKDYAIPNPKDPTTPWTPAAPASTTTQRLSILGGTWPGSEIDIVADRYVQFAVSPAPGKTWALDSISLWAGSAGGSNMGYRIQVGKLADFTDATALLDMPSNTSYAMFLQAFPSTLTLQAGETLYLRIFPWYKGSAMATGKYLCLQTLTIHGMVQ